MATKMSSRWDGVVHVMLSHGYKDAVPLERCYYTRGMAHGYKGIVPAGRYAR